MKSLALVLCLAVSGCATVATPPNATFGQKVIADSALIVSIVNDVKAKCVPEFAPLGPVVVAALQIAVTPADVISDIMAVVQASPSLYKDAQGVACVIKTVIEDLKAAKPVAGTKAADMLEMAQQTLFAMGYDASDPLLCVASR